MSATKKKYESKIHCRQCGRKRNMKLAFLFETPIEVAEGEDPKVEGSLVFLNVKNFHKIAKERLDVDLPKLYIGQCTDCGTQTYYTLNENRKLVVFND